MLALEIREPLSSVVNSAFKTESVGKALAVNNSKHSQIIVAARKMNINEVMSCLWYKGPRLPSCLPWTGIILLRGVITGILGDIFHSALDGPMKNTGRVPLALSATGPPLAPCLSVFSDRRSFMRICL